MSKQELTSINVRLDVFIEAPKKEIENLIKYGKADDLVNLLKKYGGEISGGDTYISEVAIDGYNDNFNTNFDSKDSVDINTWLLNPTSITIKD